VVQLGLFAECGVLYFQGLCDPRTRTCTVNWSSKILEDKDFPQGQQHCLLRFIIDRVNRSYHVEHVQKKSGERNEDNRFQVQLEEDGVGSTGQSWMETSSL